MKTGYRAIDTEDRILAESSTYIRMIEWLHENVFNHEIIAIETTYSNDMPSKKIISFRCK